MLVMYDHSLLFLYNFCRAESKHIHLEWILTTLRPSRLFCPENIPINSMASFKGDIVPAIPFHC